MIIWRPYRSYSSGSSGNPSTTVLLEDEASWRTCMAGVIYGESWTNAHNFQLSERADRHELSPRGDVANSAQLVTVASRTKNSDNEQQQRTTEHLRIANSSPYLPSIKKVIGASITKMATTSSSKQMEVNPRGIPRAPFVVGQDSKVWTRILNSLADKGIGRTMSTSMWAERMRKSKLLSRNLRKLPRM